MGMGGEREVHWNEWNDKSLAGPKAQSPSWMQSTQDKWRSFSASTASLS